ncbi:MAG: hypothetical protein Q7Q73_07385 [Verrucomicrobiota bacterium JB024]|nr:hypothetical protein [Verrucomicrobiota bacterium JB024]
MPTRLIREGILDSDRVNSLSEREELFYRKLFSVADDYGLFDAREPILKARLYALRPTVRDTDMTHLLAACEKAGLIVLYTDAGKPYGVILNFGQQRKGKPKLPVPPLDALGLVEKKEGVYISFTKPAENRNGPLPSVTDSYEPLLNSKCETRNSESEADTNISRTGAREGASPQEASSSEHQPADSQEPLTLESEPSPKPKDGSPSYDQYPGFRRFWEAYPPRKGVRAGKHTALEAWRKGRLEPLTDVIVRHVTAMASTRGWQDENGKFIPMAKKYLNDRRWEDEIENTQPRRDDEF